MASAVPIDQVPDPPSLLNVAVLGYDGVQISFDWPKRDGGQALSQYVITYDTTEGFSSANQMVILQSLPQQIPYNGERFVFDFAPTNPPLKAGLTYFIKMNSVNGTALTLEWIQQFHLLFLQGHRNHQVLLF